MHTYLAFARMTYTESLTLQGTLDVPDGADAQQLARATFGDAWLELVLVAQSELHWAIQEDAPVATEAHT